MTLKKVVDLMNIKINYNGDAYLKNLAFIKASLIRASIENMNVSLKDKEIILEKILQYLKNN